MRCPPIALAAAWSALAATSAPAQASRGVHRRMVEWPTYGGDAGGMKYSPLADINRANVHRLTRSWSWATGETPIRQTDSTKAARPGWFQATPLMLNDTLYFPTPFNRVVALDATTGRELWKYDPGSHRYGQPSNGTGFVHRGVAAWTDGHERRIFLNTRWRLIALDAASGTPIRSFGNNGEIDLTLDLSRPVNRLHYTNTSPPVVWGDLVILGNGVADRLAYASDPPGDIQAFNVHTGKRVWRFKTVPEAGEVGNETWQKDSWRTTGHTNVWAPFTVDSARGLVYLPIGTPSNDWYGGRRTGDNLFAESIVCLNARTGERVWHFQVVHHGVWDYDLPAPPNVVAIRRGGRTVDAVIVPTKQGFVFAFDRVTGAPLWPVTERPVPRSDVPGEQTSTTQPMSAVPRSIAQQGFGSRDLADFTPAIKAAALEEFGKYRAGPLYTPPSIVGTITAPGSIGGAGWGGGAFDPNSGTLYLKATNSPSLWKLVRRATPSDTNDAEYFADLPNSSVGVRMAEGAEGTAREGASLPLNKPPYGTLTAIDMSTGRFRWQVPLGDTPEVRNHPVLKGVKLPARLGVAGAPGGVVTKGGLVFITGGGHTLYAIDAASGLVRWEGDLGQVGYANPMTYRTKAGTQYVAIATGIGAGATLQVFALR